MAVTSRVQLLQKQLRRSPTFDWLLVEHPANIQYLSGFTGSAGALLVGKTQAVFFSDGRYKAQAEQQVRGARIVIGARSPLALASDWLRSRKSRNVRVRVGIESSHLTVASKEQLRRALGSDFQLRPAPTFLESMRMVKDFSEIKKMRAAAFLGSTLFETLLETIQPGATETSVASELEYAARKLGASAMSFSTIIASGKRSALPHGVASGAAIPRRGFVVCDFGVILASYCSDMTRTVHVGRPTSEARRAYGAVRDAQQAGLEAIKPGRACGDVDDAVRKELTKSGFGSYFTHSTGHGVGLEVHEAPRLAVGQTQELRPGMVVTVEPGVYIQGNFGIRIEDMVLVTRTGGEVLTPIDKELTVI